MTNCENCIPVFRHGQFDGPGANNPSYRNFIDSISNQSMLYPLTEKGGSQIMESVRQLSNYQEIDLVIVSQFLRTQQSAEVISRLVKKETGHKVEIVTSSLLNPVWIPVDSLSEEEYKKIQMGGEKKALANYMFNKWAEGQIGETPELVRNRIEMFLAYLKDIINRNSIEQAAVITHASFASATQRYVRGIELSEPRDEGEILNVAGYYLLEIGDKVADGNYGLVMFREKYLNYQETERISLATL